VSGKKPENFVCVSNERFTKIVPSGSDEGITYEVKYEAMYVANKDEIEKRWACECRGYITWHISKENYQCKHIKEVKLKHWCGWKQKEHGGEPIKHVGMPAGCNIDYTCWNCGRLAYHEDEIT